jgi:hypothetical protein
MKPPQIMLAMLGVINADALARHNIFLRKILGGFFYPKFFSLGQIPAI